MIHKIELSVQEIVAILIVNLETKGIKFKYDDLKFKFSDSHGGALQGCEITLKDKIT